MVPFYFNDLKGQRHYAKTRKEAERLRVEVGGGYVIIQTANHGAEQSLSSRDKVAQSSARSADVSNSSSSGGGLLDPLKCGVTVEEIEILRARAEEINKMLPLDHYCIRAGRAAQAILCLPFMQEGLVAGSLKRAAACGWFMSKQLEVPEGMMSRAVDLYCKPDGIIAHYRHNAAPPSTFTGHGAFLRLIDGSYSIEHISNDRVTYGNRSKIVELVTVNNVLAYISFLASKNWYTSFLDSSARAIGLSDLPYWDDSRFKSWRDRAAAGEI